jgi:RND family efflux transporter MFP subunit
MGFVTGLVTIMECDRVSIGFKGRKGVRVAALSHSAEFGKDTNLVRAIGSVLDEAVDQKAVIFYPLPEGVAPLVTRSHDDLAQQCSLGAICTVPFGQGEEFFGALTLERQAAKPFDGSAVEMIKTVASLVGPILEEKRKEERWITTKAAEAAVAQLKKFTGPGHFALKMATAVAIIVVLFFTFAKGVHRVRAPTVLEGVVQRSISAPFNGYVMEAPARPGDVVRQGSMLCRLDDRELKLERLKWATQKEQFLKQHSEATANHDRAQALINEAKIDQAEAQVSLLDEQLSRAKIVAPFDGIVTSGDFYQSLGTAVERGQVLFEVAPLHGYRIVVQVDERDIGWVAIKQRGELALPSVPGTVFPFTITRITPISTAKEGRNYFRVEAELDQASEKLRPGMEGLGKISAGRARFIWIWSHDVTEWIRLKVWSWIP